MNDLSTIRTCPHMTADQCDQCLELERLRAEVERLCETAYRSGFASGGNDAERMFPANEDEGWAAWKKAYARRLGITGTS